MIAANPPELSRHTRQKNLTRLQAESFDLVVIGGGITGAGVALDAVLRGLKVALIEKSDFAAGTSSKSSKLIHGGLRYLEQFEFGLVREALRERATLRRLAPHLCEPLPFLIPLYEGGRVSPLGASKWRLRIGLRLYDWLAGKQNIEPHRWLNPSAVLNIAPTLAADGLRGGFLYYDCLTNDARLVIEVIKAAAGFGAVIVNYAEARGFAMTEQRINSLDLTDGLTGQPLTVSTSLIVNAAGVWSNRLLPPNPNSPQPNLRPSKGIHIVLPAEKIAHHTAVLIPSLGEQRFLFVIPWLGRTLIGTTDTDYQGDIENPHAEPQEIERLLQSAASAFPQAQLSASDIISAFAGLRPLVGDLNKATKDLSRKDEILVDDRGMITVIGGKLTTYRHMAERVVDAVLRNFPRNAGRNPSGAQSLTAEVELAGGGVSNQAQAAEIATAYELPAATVAHLMHSYGGNYKTLLAIICEADDLKAPLINGLPHIAAEVVYAARYEMVTCAEDFLARRTRLILLAGDEGRACAAIVESLLAREATAAPPAPPPIP